MIGEGRARKLALIVLGETTDWIGARPGAELARPLARRRNVGGDASRAIRMSEGCDSFQWWVGSRVVWGGKVLRGPDGICRREGVGVTCSELENGLATGMAQYIKITYLLE